MKNISEIRDECARCGIHNLGEFVTNYSMDERSGVKKLVEKARKILVIRGIIREIIFLQKMQITVN